jgi:hypothetical protein
MISAKKLLNYLQNIADAEGYIVVKSGQMEEATALKRTAIHNHLKEFQAVGILTKTGVINKVSRYKLNMCEHEVSMNMREHVHSPGEHEHKSEHKKSRLNETEQDSSCSRSCSPSSIGSNFIVKEDRNVPKVHSLKNPSFSPPSNRQCTKPTTRSEHEREHEKLKKKLPQGARFEFQNENEQKLWKRMILLDVGSRKLDVINSIRSGERTMVFGKWLAWHPRTEADGSPFFKGGGFIHGFYYCLDTLTEFHYQMEAKKRSEERQAPAPAPAIALPPPEIIDVVLYTQVERKYNFYVLDCKRKKTPEEDTKLFEEWVAERYQNYVQQQHPHTKETFLVLYYQRTPDAITAPKSHFYPHTTERYGTDNQIDKVLKKCVS